MAKKLVGLLKVQGKTPEQVASEVMSLLQKQQPKPPSEPESIAVEALLAKPRLQKSNFINPKTKEAVWVITLPKDENISGNTFHMEIPDEELVKNYKLIGKSSNVSFELCVYTALKNKPDLWDRLYAVRIKQDSTSGMMNQALSRDDYFTVEFYENKKYKSFNALVSDRCQKSKWYGNIYLKFFTLVIYRRVLEKLFKENPKEVINLFNMFPYFVSDTKISLSCSGLSVFPEELIGYLSNILHLERNKDLILELVDLILDAIREPGRKWEESDFIKNFPHLKDKFEFSHELNGGILIKPIKV